LTAFAAANLKGTNLPVPAVTPATPQQPKTLPHALGRAAASSSIAIGPDARLGKALKEYALAFEKVFDHLVGFILLLISLHLFRLERLV